MKELPQIPGARGTTNGQEQTECMVHETRRAVTPTTFLMNVRIFIIRWIVCVMNIQVHVFVQTFRLMDFLASTLNARFSL